MRLSYRRHHNPQTPEKNGHPFFSKTLTVQTKEDNAPFFQAKGLTVGQPGDQYEQEADAMANAVVNQSAGAPAIHKKEISTLQRESLATPLEDEKLATAEQRMEKDKMIQEQPEPLAEEEKEETPVQTKGETGSNTASPSVTHQIQQKAGKGKTMPQQTRAEMESAFGADFSEVNIHTDGESVEMNRNLHAQAFTHGRDIYFNAGKYKPETSSGKHLLAHELTHVVQQGHAAASVSKKKGIQCKPSGTAAAAATTCGKPAQCPADFCTPFSSTIAAEAARSALSPVLLAGIASKVSPRVVPLWSQYLFGGSAPQDLTPSFGVDFITSMTTAATTAFLVAELETSLKSSPPAFPSGVNTIVIDIPAQIPAAVSEIGTPGSAHEMNFDVIGEIPGNIAGGVGTTQLSCPVGATPSPFDDARQALGKAIVTRDAAGTLTVFPLINYSVKDTIDLCPGNCGATIEQLATVPLSMMEASGISGDVPFTVNFPSLPIAPFTVTPSVPIPITPVATSGTVTASVLRIRRKPSLTATIVGGYPRGTLVQVICQTSGSAVEGNTTWYQTDKGFISGRYVTLSGGTPSNC